MYKKDLTLHKQWTAMLYKIKESLGTRPKDLNAVLFLVGVHELGQGPRDFEKEEKQDLMHIAVCKVLSLAGYYQLVGQDAEGWPQWEIVKKLPRFDLIEQETLLKIQILEYFKQEFNWEL